MPKIFISYRHVDSPQVTRDVFYELALEYGRDNVFMDLDTMIPGLPFPEQIDRMTSSCDLLIAVIGKDWLGIEKNGCRRLQNPDDIVRREVATALKREVPVIPLLVDDCDPPPDDDLPDDLKNLAIRHALHVHSGRYFKATILELIAGIEKALTEASLAQVPVVACQHRSSAPGADQGLAPGADPHDCQATTQVPVLPIAPAAIHPPGGIGRAHTPVRPTPSPPTTQAVTVLPGGVELTWVRLPAGSFRRGCPPEFASKLDREFPTIRNLRQVLDTYPWRLERCEEIWISTFPVTNEQFSNFLRAERPIPGISIALDSLAQAPGMRFSYRSKGPRDPVIGVTWAEAVQFADWVGARLPTRAEVEYACRGPESRVYPWGNEFGEANCNTAEAKKGTPLPVDTFASGISSFGVFDLVGNVWEWVQDERDGRRMTVGASYGWTGEIYGAGFFDFARFPDALEPDVGLRLACNDPSRLNFPIR